MRMDRKMPREIDLNQAAVARLEFLHWRCQDLPPVYQNLIPATTDAAELLEVEKTVRGMFASDIAEHLGNPWMRTGKTPQMLDWSNVAPEEKEARFVEVQPEKGLTAAVRPGFRNHPAVLAAINQAETIGGMLQVINGLHQDSRKLASTIGQTLADRDREVAKATIKVVLDMQAEEKEQES